MLSWQWVWGLPLFQAFLVYHLGDLGEDLAKLLLMESPITRITWYLMSWTIQFDFSIVVCLDGTLALSFLLHRTSPAIASLLSYRIVVKSCVICCICVVDCCFCTIVFFCYVVFYVVACTAFMVGSETMMYIIFATLVVGSWVLLCNQLGFLLAQFGSALMFWFSIMFLFIQIKKKNKKKKKKPPLIVTVQIVLL